MKNTTVLEETAKSSQQYTSKVRPANVFVPKSSARLGRAEQLSRDMDRLLGSTARIAKDQYKLSIDAVNRVAVEDYVDYKTKLDELNASKTPGTDRRQLAQSAGNILGGISRKFENADQQTAYDKVFSNPAISMLGTAAEKWELEQKGIDRVIAIRNQDNLAAKTGSETTTFQLTNGKEVYQSAGKNPQDFEYVVADRMNDEFMVNVREDYKQFLFSNGEFDRNKFLKTFNEKYRLFVKFEDGAFNFESNGENKHGTKDEVTREKITKSFGLMETYMKKKSGMSKSEFESNFLAYIKERSSGRASGVDELTGRYKTYDDDKTLRSNVDHTFGLENISPALWSRADAIRDKSIANRNELTNNRRDTNSDDRPFTVRQLNDKQFMEDFNGDFQSKLKVANDETTNPHLRQILNEEISRIIDSGNAGSFFSEQAKAFKYGSKQSAEATEKEFGKYLDVPTVQWQLSQSMKPAAYEEYILSRHFMKQGIDIDQSYIDELKKKDPTPPSEDEMAAVQLLRSIDPRAGNSSFRVYKVLNKAGAKEEAEKVMQTNLAPYDYKPEVGSDETIMTRSAAMKQLTRTTPGLDGVITDVINRQLELKDVSGEFRALGDKHGYVIYPAINPPYTGEDKGLYIIKIKGASFGDIKVVDINEAFGYDDTMIKKATEARSKKVKIDKDLINTITQF